MHIFIDAKFQIGLISHQKTKSLLDEGDVADLQVSTIYKGVRAFLRRLWNTALRIYPLMMHSCKMFALSTLSRGLVQTHFSQNTSSQGVFYIMFSVLL